MRKLGINLQSMPEMSVEEQLKLWSEAGFQAIFTGMHSIEEQENLSNLFAKHGLDYESIHAPFGSINDIWLDNEAGEKMCQDLDTCIDRCAMSNVPIMVIHMSSGLTPPPVTDLGRSRYEKLIEHAGKKNVRLAFENLRKLSHLAWVFEHFADNDTVTMCWDCGHQTCFTPQIEFMPMFGDRLSYLHIHDNYGVLNQDSHLIPFDGVIDFEKVAKQIKASGFTGTLTFETIRRNSNHYEGFTWEEYIRRNAEAAKRLAKMIDEDN